MFAEFEIKIDLKFAHINARLNNVEEAASSSELRVQDLLTRFEAIERREAEVERKMVSVESSVESVRRGETDVKLAAGRRPGDQNPASRGFELRRQN